MNIQAIIFDMDGLLIDSEPYWGQAMCEVLSSVGIPFTRERAIQTRGHRVNETVENLLAEFGIKDRTVEEVSQMIFDRVKAIVAEKGCKMPGVDKVMDFARKNGLKIGVGSSSPEDVVNCFLKHISVYDSLDAVVTGDRFEYAKPHPAIFLACAEKMGAKPSECLVFEDSLSGTLAAKAASMTCIAVPDAEHRYDRRLCIADRILFSLEEFDPAMLENR